MQKKFYSNFINRRNLKVLAVIAAVNLPGTTPVFAAPSHPRKSVVKQVPIGISGTVTDEKNQPVPGVSIMVKGTQTGTVTDVNGKYALSAEPGAALVFSFIGYTRQEVTVGSQQ